MPKDTRKAARNVSTKSKKAGTQGKTQPLRRKEHWLYGFHLKNRHVRRLSEEFGLPFETDPLEALFTVQTHLINRCMGLYQWHSITHRGKDAIILAFTQDDGRKRLHLNMFTEEEMQRVRIELLLPEGSTPKWYNVDDSYDGYAELSSDDEDLPPFRSPSPLPARSKSESADSDQHEVGASGNDPDKSIAGGIHESDGTTTISARTRQKRAKREKTIQRPRGNCRRKKDTKNS